MHQLFHGDCLVHLASIANQSINLAICDLPYGTTTAFEWDVTPDLAKLWAHLERVLVPFAPVIMFGSQPFTTDLINSKRDWFKYEWIWVKNRGTGFLHAGNKPLKLHENILVFSSGTTIHSDQSDRRMPYFPQGLRPGKPRRDGGYRRTMACARQVMTRISSGITNFPVSVLCHDAVQGTGHPTAKPIDLLEYLVKTYSRRGDMVLDPTMGIGSTGVAAVRCGCDFIGIEKNETYYVAASERLLGEKEGVRGQQPTSAQARSPV